MDALKARTTARAPKASADDNIIPPPASVVVETVPRVVLYKADGTALKRPIGYKR